MPRSQDVLADAASSLKMLVGRFMADFDDRHRTQTAPNLPNHVIWCLGHISIYLHRTAEKLDGRPLPEDDFVTGDGAAGNAERYDTESIAFDSRPNASASQYPGMARARQIFEAAAERLASALRSATDAQLEQRINWAGIEIPLHGLAARIIFHSGFHTGQIVDLRRALGMERVIRPAK